MHNGDCENPFFIVNMYNAMVDVCKEKAGKPAEMVSSASP